MRVLADTNVFLDFLLRREPFYESCREFFSYFRANKHQIVISPMSFCDIECVLRKVEADPKKRKQVLQSIYSFVYKIIDLTPDDVINVLYEDPKDFEDALLIASAERCFLDGIVTDNQKGFANATLPVYSPKEIVELLQKRSR